MIKVHFFAGLKRHFPVSVELKPEGLQCVGDVLARLKADQPDAAELLDACRIAVDENFVSPELPLAGIQEVFVIPPSSGG